jgi:hypothetical protein
LELQGWFIGSDERDIPTWIPSLIVAGWRRELRGGTAVVAISGQVIAKDSQVCDLIVHALCTENRVESTWLLPLHSAEADSPGRASASAGTSMRPGIREP